MQETGTILANVLPTDAADKSVIWESSDDLVVKVDENGNLTAISGGTAKVYAVSVFDNSIKDFCEVTVLQPVTGISLNENTIEITEDGSFKLIATVLPDKAANKGVKWTSSDMSVAVVSGDGTVFGIKAGNATIMATTDDGGFVALCKVKVAKGFVPVSDISLN